MFYVVCTYPVHLSHIPSSFLVQLKPSLVNVFGAVEITCDVVVVLKICFLNASQSVILKDGKQIKILVACDM